MKAGFKIGLSKEDKQNMANDVYNRADAKITPQLSAMHETIQSLGGLKPSGVDSASNILSYTENKGVYVANDTGGWYYWNGSAYVYGGSFQSDINAVDLGEIIPESTIEETMKKIHIKIEEYTGIQNSYDSQKVYMILLADTDGSYGTCFIIRDIWTGDCYITYFQQENVKKYRTGYTSDDDTLACEEIFLSNIADGSITIDKINKESLSITDITTKSELLGNVWIGSRTSDGTLTISSGANHKMLKYTIDKKRDKYIECGLSSTSGYYYGNVIVLTDENDKYIAWVSYDSAISNTRTWLTYNSATKKYTIDCQKLLETYSNIKYIYIAYTNTLIPYVYGQFLLSDFKFLVDDFSIEEEFILPSKIHCVVNNEMNVYYENAIQYGDMNTIVKVDTINLSDCERYKKRLIWNPKTSGTTSAKMRLYKKSLKNYDKEVDINFVALNSNIGSGATKKVLIIGDSKVAYGQIAFYLNTIFSSDSMNLTLVGTRHGNSYNSNDPNINDKHEGRGGWSAYNYCNHSSYGGINNPFYNNGFDFSYYITNSGVEVPDIVFINLGTNDSANGLNETLPYYEQMLTSIHNYNPNIKVVFGLTEGVYKEKLDIEYVNAFLFKLKKELIKLYDNKEDENIFLCPLYLNMDLYEDYDFQQVPLSKCDELKNSSKTRRYTSDGIHQNEVGFYKNAYTMYYTIKYIVSLD